MLCYRQQPSSQRSESPDYSVSMQAVRHPLRSMLSTLAFALLCLNSCAALAVRVEGAARGGSIAKELIDRVVGTPRKRQRDGDQQDKLLIAELRRNVLDALLPYGDPALAVSPDGRAAIESAAAALESQNSVLRPATRDLSALDGRWRVRFSDAPPPSNGALGPFVGEPFQIVDSRSQSYVNELGFLNGALKVELAADFEPSSDTALRVCFRTLRLVAFGVPLPAFNFPAGTERTWLLTYTDDEMRLVRAGVDGGRSTARELGLISEDEGQSADAYLFVLTRAPDAPPASDPISRFVNDRKRKQLKQRLLDACDGQDFGASSTDADADAIAAIVDELAPLNPTAAPARSPLLQGVWRVEWTTEAELLYLTKNGLPGIAGEAAYQAIRPVAVTTADATADTITNADTGTFNGADKAERTEAPQRLQLVNRVALERGNGLTVNSSCDPASDDSVNFRFSSCSATLYGLTFPLPPVGTGSFNVLYLDEALRICRDSRGDLQICSRAVEGEVDI